MLIASAALLAPTAAHAATSSASRDKEGTLTYTAASADANRLVVTRSGTTVKLTDTGAGVSIAAGNGCWGSGSTVYCYGVDGMRLLMGEGGDVADSKAVALPTGIYGGGGDDRLSSGSSGDYLSGADGNDTLSAGPGRDYFDGGAGADTVSARDDVADWVGCGEGVDGGTADPGDTIYPTCENVSTTQTPTEPTEPGGKPDPGDGGGGTAKPPGANPNPNPPGGSSGPLNMVPPVLPAQAPAVSPKGVARVQVACPAVAGRCTGRVDIFLIAGRVVASSGKVSASRRRRVGRRIGRAKFSVAAGAKANVPVRLNRRGRRRVMRRNRKLRVRLELTTRDSTGRITKTQRTITLRARRAPRRGRARR